jgi:hypothetical protein
MKHVVFRNVQVLITGLCSPARREMAAFNCLLFYSLSPARSSVQAQLRGRSFSGAYGTVRLNHNYYENLFRFIEIIIINSVTLIIDQTVQMKKSRVWICPQNMGIQILWVLPAWSICTIIITHK